MGPPYHVRPCLCFMLIDNIYTSNSVIWYIKRSQLEGNYSKPWRNWPGTEASGLGPLRLGRSQRHADVAQGESWTTPGRVGNAQRLWYHRGITHVDHMNHTVDHRCISTSIISIFSSLFFSSLILVYSLCLNHLNLPIYRFTYLPRLSTDLFVNPM